MMRVLLPVVLSGCAQYGPFLDGPDRMSFCTTVEWLSREKIKRVCPQGSHSCATVGLEMNRIYAVRPESWDDSPVIQLLGHEVLHNMGATHQ